MHSGRISQWGLVNIWINPQNDVQEVVIRLKALCGQVTSLWTA